MAVVPIRIIGDPVLRSVAAPVTTFDRELEHLVTDLGDTMRAAPGAGLAAPQIGISLRVFVFEIDGEIGHLINPVVGRLTEEELDGEEGCLSIPGLRWNLKRPRLVVARGQDVTGEPIAVTGSDRLARALSHETDHLDGVLFIDRLDSDTRARALAEIAAADLQGEPRPQVRASPHPLVGGAT